MLRSNRNARLQQLHLLERQMRSRGVEERYLSAETVGQRLRGTRKAPVWLVKSLGSDRSSLVRASVAESLGYIEDRFTSRALVRSLSDESPIVRAYAAGSLGRIGGGNNRKALTRLKDSERSARARVGIAEGLLWLGDPTGLEMLRRLLRSKQYRVRCAAANALASVPLNARANRIALDVASAALALERTEAAKSSLRNALTALQRKRKARH